MADRKKPRHEDIEDDSPEAIAAGVRIIEAGGTRDQAGAMYRAMARKKKPAAETPNPAPVVPDIDDASARAPRLPAAEWLRRVRDMKHAGDIIQQVRGVIERNLPDLSPAEIAMETSMALERRVAKQVREPRKRARLTQEQVARAADVSLAYLSRIENGRHEPTLTTLAKLANVLGVTVSELVK
jgi:DNA-binding XRE family transcriptional regulator